MKSPHTVRRAFILTGLGAVQLLASAARADIPADYKGTPYLGAPKVIPGRVELEDCDLGGEGVAYHADHRRSNSAGYEPISGNDYRPGDKDLPNICKTNEANKDFMVGTGAPYPSTTPTKEEHYIGYAHAGDWVKITVDVKVAGTYNVSSTWASANATWGCSIWFNDGHVTTPDPQRPKDGVNKSGVIEMPGTSDYHKWKDFPNFTKVTLSAGVQVMTFHLEKQDHLQYGHLIFDLEGGNPATGAAGADGAAGAGGGAAGTAGGAAGTTGGGAGIAGGTAGTVGGGAAGTTVNGAAGVSAGEAGTNGGPGAAGTIGSATGTAGSSGTTHHQSSGGCTAAGGSRGTGALSSILLVACAALARRRRRV